ncbi:hypothetical protein ACH5RR_033801 [Cinchona calisaya]|uniref:Uncharacterized protein n=1 Tax=Cinchona calisaya TaxID=153742 RepID=A0ABD2Y9Z7_9GENT
MNSSQPMYHDQYDLRENLGEEGWKREAEYLRRELDRKTEEHKRDYENLKASTRNLEIQLEQVARLNNERPLGMLPSDTIPNPKEQCKAITLRSGKELEEKVGRNSMKNGEQEGVEDEDKEKESLQMGKTK